VGETELPNRTHLGIASLRSVAKSAILLFAHFVFSGEVRNSYPVSDNLGNRTDGIHIHAPKLTLTFRAGYSTISYERIVIGWN